MRILSHQSAGLALSALLVVTSALYGCAAPGPTVTPVGKSDVQFGSVLQVREIWVDVGPNMPGMGMLAGAAVGGVMGNNIVSGKGQTTATLGGAVLGGMAGAQLDPANRNRKRLTELTVRFDNGVDRVFNIEPEEVFRVGERIKHFNHNGYDRITH